MDAQDISSCAGNVYAQSRLIWHRTRYARVARICYRLQGIVNLEWLALPVVKAAGASASLAYLDAEEDVEAPTPLGSMRSHLPRRITLVTRSQILRLLKSPCPEYLHKHDKDTQQMIRSWHAATYAEPRLLHPDTATGTTRPLRPPDIEVEPIRAPPHTR